jgi:16S rRNA (uracil1498-N3)-methyltransferase
MTRLFVHPESLQSEHIKITGDQARYLSVVLRVTPGEVITLFDGQGYKYECKIVQSHKKEVVAERLSKEPFSVESPVSIILAQGLPKSDKMDLIVEKATELGIRSITPLITEYSQVRHTEKVERWRKIALSASQQSGRDRIPDILDPIGFLEYLTRISAPLKEAEGSATLSGLIFSEEKEGSNFKEILSGLRSIKNIVLLIGPEGGFSKKEVSSAVRHGFIEVSIGPRILRTETAPIAALSIIQYELGDMGNVPPPPFDPNGTEA